MRAFARYATLRFQSVFSPRSSISHVRRMCSSKNYLSSSEGKLSYLPIHIHGRGSHRGNKELCEKDFTFLCSFFLVLVHRNELFSILETIFLYCVFKQY